MSVDEWVLQEVRRRIIEWYRCCGEKDLPWRRTRNAWHILLAVFLLRLTRRETVAKFYSKILELFPDPQTLIKVGVNGVKDALKPLGLYNVRAWQLIEFARKLVDEFGGVIPCDEGKLKSLPGVGDYTASLILLKLCGKPKPLLDTNTIRVLMRVFGLQTRRGNPYTDPQLYSVATKLIGVDLIETEEVNFGLMDLAHKICTKRPHCSSCPLADLCRYAKTSANA